MHGVDGEVGGDGGLGRGKTLRYGGASKDAASARRMPERTGIGEDVRTYVGEREEGKDVLDGRVVGEGFRGFDQGCVL